MTAGSKVWSLRGYQWGSLAAICTWGDWRASLRPDPCQIDGTEPNRQWRCSLQRSGAREAIARGALTGVYVLDINHRPATAHEQPDTTGPPLEVGTARRARAHWRAGHWQNYRIATRDPTGAITGSTCGERDHDRHCEGRWVQLVLINAHPVAATTRTGYRVYPTTTGRGRTGLTPSS